MKFSKKGDQGETSLLGGQRIPKYDLRPETYGTLDEASSVLGVARAMTDREEIGAILLSVQKDLLVLGAELSALPDVYGKLTRTITDGDIARLEKLIDELQEDVPLKNEFIYPGGTVVVPDRRGPDGCPAGRKVGRPDEERGHDPQRADQPVPEPPGGHAFHPRPVRRGKGRPVTLTGKPRAGSGKA